MAFNLRKNNHTDTNNIIQYNYYKTPFYKNQYEKTIQNGGYVKIPYRSKPNTPNLLLDNEYITQNIYISKKIHTIENVDFDGELIIEHISSTNTKSLYTCILLKTENVFATGIDRMIQAKEDFTLDLNELLFMSDCNQCIFYESKTPAELTKIIVFTQPILVTSNFDAFTKVNLFSPHNNVYSLVRIHPILGNVVKEGFKEGLATTPPPTTVTTQVGYCQLIDENDPSIGSEAQVIVPIKGDTVVNEAAISSVRMLLYLCAFAVLLLCVVFGIPWIYNVMIVKFVLENTHFTPQQKLDRLNAIETYVGFVMFILAFSLINNGIINNIPMYAIMGTFILLFIIACYTVLYFYRAFFEESKRKFLEQFNTPGTGNEPASFEKIRNDLGGLIADNGTSLLWDTTYDEKTGEKKSSFNALPAIFCTLFFIAMLMIMYWMGIQDAPGSSVFLSFKFVLIFLAIYLAILIKSFIHRKPLRFPSVQGNT